MRSLFLVLFLLPVCTRAQPEYRLGFYTGLVACQANYRTTAVVPYHSGNVHPWFTLEARAEWKHLQSGLGIGNGMLRDNIDEQREVYVAGVLTDTQVVHTRHDIARPAFEPHLFVHYKIQLRPFVNVYAGIAAGVLTGNNSLQPSGRLTSITGGFDAGASLKILSRVSLQLAHNFRVAHVKSAGVRTISSTGQGDHVLLQVPAYDVLYVTSSFGLNVRL